MRTSKTPTLTSFLLAITLFQFWLSLPCLAATNCVQKFGILGIVQNREGNHVVWIAEEIFGECMWTRIIKIELLDDSVKVVVDNSYRSWKSIREDMGQPIEGAFTEFTKENSTWKFNNKLYHVTIAESDTGLYNEYKRKVNDPQGWNGQYRTDVTLPEFSSEKVRLIYYYPRGLYLNYSVDQIYFLQENFLLVFTKQPLLAPGGDTIHGFLLLKWRVQTK